MPRWFKPLAIVCFLMFVGSPALIVNAPFESTMGLVQKIFYYHMPAASVFLLSALVCGYASVRFLIGRDSRHDRLAWAAAELLVLFGAIALVTGPLWARKAWGVWWQWDVRLTSSLMGWMIGVAYLLVRKYGGPGSDKLAAGLAVFGMANVPFIYISVNYWRTIHPTTNVVPSLPLSMGLPFWFCFSAFVLLFMLLLTLRVRLEEQRARVDALYLAMEER
jgi:heme exporter protein C